jgi:flagellin-like hook-associated protein FlgL
MSQVISELSSGPKAQTAADNPAGYPGLVDENFAQEITFSSGEILMQSGVAMLGQARQSPWLVLTLLRC